MILGSNILTDRAKHYQFSSLDLIVLVYYIALVKNESEIVAASKIRSPYHFPYLNLLYHLLRNATIVDYGLRAPINQAKGKI